ncbi:MAG: hypothetical protein INR73_17985 [Williamsia sp.]|nr:hypothetical protein [Williamsia sp.]
MERNTRFTLIFIGEEKTTKHSSSFKRIEDVKASQPDWVLTQIMQPSNRSRIIHVYLLDYSAFKDQLRRLSKSTWQESVIIADRAYRNALPIEKAKKTQMEKEAVINSLDADNG